MAKATACLKLVSALMLAAVALILLMQVKFRQVHYMNMASQPIGTTGIVKKWTVGYGSASWHGLC